ncbi:hypothetical protein STHERM_c21150 [Spirochaeta thermophila DSM 6192]|uniref:Regulatory protein RecX n=1 Tax=Winmispira thermophila (strain ATCC 49972 / DSM 6192 / RI 19.B1) TaxID=665571 RepID=E0RR69_WINT6|nr:hypothetical protein STHERM_c21150 [Spirochaeta thermophila DSM 6192]
MGTRRRGEASSSPSGDLIVGIEKEGAPPGCAVVHLADGSFFCLLRRTLREEGLEVGVRVRADRLSNLAARDERTRMEEYLEPLLRRHLYTRRHLRTKLLRKGFSSSQVDALLDTLEARGVVDDRVYSRTWIELRTRKSPLGRGALRQGLLRKGVDPQAVRASLDEWDEATLREGARQYVMRLVRQGVSGERIFARMARRGFGPAEVRRLLEEEPGEDVEEQG